MVFCCEPDSMPTEREPVEVLGRALGTASYTMRTSTPVSA